MRMRIYPTKSNTIASGYYSAINSSQCPVTDLFYGGGGTDTSLARRNAYSRFIAAFDLTDLRDKINSSFINTALTVTYKLKMRNAIPRDKVLEPEYEFDQLDKVIAASYDLVAFPVNKDFDEGRGFDMLREYYTVKQAGSPILSGYSNWNRPSMTTTWDAPGVYVNPTASTSSYAVQHFAIGNEDIDMDITTMVNQWIASGDTVGKLGVAFGRGYELLSTDTRYMASFFTNKTNTAYKPYIEVVYNQAFKDDRNDVSNNRRCRLFLYTFSGNNSVNYYSAGTVSIQTYAGGHVYSGLTPTQLERGVYYVDVWMSAATKGSQYKDVWNNVTFAPGFDQTTYTQYFTIQDNYYMNNAPQVNSYSVTTYGLANDAILSIGEMTRVYVDLRVNYSTNYPKTKYDIQYRMIMNNQDEVIPWSSMNQAVLNKVNTAYFNLDTSWLLHNQTYKIQYRISELGTLRVLPEEITFKVLRSF